MINHLMTVKGLSCHRIMLAIVVFSSIYYLSE